MLLYFRLLLAIGIFSSAGCLASNWTEQGFNFGWPNPLNLPITGYCDTLDISWFRGTGTGPVPQEPYQIKIYTSIHPNLFVLDAGNGTNATVPISFPAGTQYLICMNDATGISGGCSEVFTIYPSSNTCTDLRAPATSLQVDVTANNITPVSPHDWVEYGTELDFTIGQKASNGSTTIPPYTMSIVPASGTPFQVTSDAESNARWSVSLDVGRQFFISIADKSGYIWIKGPLEVSNNSTVPTIVPIVHSWMTLPAILGMSFGFLIFGLLLATLCACFIIRYRRRKQTSSSDPEKLIQQTDQVDPRPNLPRKESTFSEKDRSLPLTPSSKDTGEDNGANPHDNIPELTVGDASARSRTEPRHSYLPVSPTEPHAGVGDKSVSGSPRISAPVAATGRTSRAFSSASRSHPLPTNLAAEQTSEDLKDPRGLGTDDNVVISTYDGHPTPERMSRLSHALVPENELSLTNVVAPNVQRTPELEPRYAVLSLATTQDVLSDQQWETEPEGETNASDAGGWEMLVQTDGSARDGTVDLERGVQNASPLSHHEMILFGVEQTSSKATMPSGRLPMPKPDPNHYFRYYRPFNDIPKGAYIPHDLKTFESDPRTNLCHIIFVMDKSGSMDSPDQVPPPNYPALFPAHNNRFGASLAAFHEFVTACKLARRPQLGFDKDAYSCIVFDHEAKVVFELDERTECDDLLEELMKVTADGGTSFEKAIGTARNIMESHWIFNPRQHLNLAQPRDIARVPVIIFLSDGMSYISDRTIRGLCRRGAELGKPPAFYAISFGAGAQEGPLKGMVQVAEEEYRRAIPNATSIPCEYKKILNEVQIGNTFIRLAESLHPHDVALIPRV